MIAIIVGLAITAMAIMVGFLAVPMLDEWFRQRHVVRESEADQQLRAMEAAERLSVLAWQARQQLSDMAVRARHQRQTQEKARTAARATIIRPTTKNH